MQVYPVRPSHRPNLEAERLESIARTHFGEATREAEGVATRFGAISSLRVRGDRKSLAVELTMDPKVPDELARETIARYNRFLEDATGYSSKERARRLRKTVGE